MQGMQVANQVVSYVGEFALGGVSLLCIWISYWSIRELKKAHQDHVQALEKGSAKHVEMHMAYQASNAETVSAIGRLTETENTQTSAIQTNTAALTQVQAEMGVVKSEMGNLRRSVDDIIREAVQARRMSSDRYRAAADSSPGRYHKKGDTR